MHGCHMNITEIPKLLCVGMTVIYMLCGLATSTGAIVLLLNCEWLLHSYVGIWCTESFEATIDVNIDVNDDIDVDVLNMIV